MFLKYYMIPATVDNRMYGNQQRVLKVASYSRVSTNFEEQLTSFELQRTYCTDLMQGSGLSENMNMITTLNNEAVGLQEMINRHWEITSGNQLAGEMAVLENLINEQVVNFDEYNDTLVRQIIKSVKLIAPQH